MNKNTVTFQKMLVLRDCGEISKILINQKGMITQAYDDSYEDSWEVLSREEMNKIRLEVRIRLETIKAKHKGVWDHIKIMDEAYRWAEWENKWKSEVIKYFDLTLTKEKFPLMLADEISDKEFSFDKQFIKRKGKLEFYIQFEIFGFYFEPKLIQQYKKTFRLIMPRVLDRG